MIAVHDGRVPVRATLNEHDRRIPALLTLGEYTVYPLEYCSEDAIAELFCVVAGTRGSHPVLRGRPKKDLRLLGRAMYRKSNILGLGNVAIHNGTGAPVALSCNWALADGGVWEGSGLEMPASLAAHAATGKAAFESLENTGKNIWSCTFAGVAPGHSAQLYSYFGIAGAMMAHALGFEEVFVYSLLSTLNGRKGVYTRKSGEHEKHWMIRFADMDASPAVSAELKEMDGTAELGLIDLEFSLGDDYLGDAARMVGIKDADELRRHSQEIARKQLAWIKQTQQAGGLVARL